MQKFVIFLIFCMVGICPLYADNVQESYVTVSFSQTVPDSSITWTNSPGGGSSSSSFAISHSSETGRTEVWDGNTWWDNVTTQTTTTSVTVSTMTLYIPVNLTFTLWDTVTWDKQDAQNWFDGEEGFKKNGSYDYDWSRAWERGNSNESRTFQIRSDSKEAVTSLTYKLDELYGQLFPLQTKIYDLIYDIDAYISNPAQDKSHSAMMSELAKLRRDEYELKKNISSTRANLLNTQGDGEKGWKVETYVSVDVDTSTTTNTTTVPHDWSWGCFVASTTLGDGKSLEEAWKKEGCIPIEVDHALIPGKVVPTGHYQGLVYMLFDAQNRPLLPGEATHNHPVLTPEALQYKAIDEIRAGDEVIRGNNEVVTVARVESRHYEGPVYNIKAQGSFSFAETNYIITKGMNR